MWRNSMGNQELISINYLKKLTNFEFRNLGIRPFSWNFLKKNTSEEELLLCLSPAEEVTDRRIVYKQKSVDIHMALIMC